MSSTNISQIIDHINKLDIPSSKFEIFNINISNIKPIY